MKNTAFLTHYWDGLIQHYFSLYEKYEMDGFFSLLGQIVQGKKNERNLNIYHAFITDY